MKLAASLGPSVLRQLGERVVAQTQPLHNDSSQFGTEHEHYVCNLHLSHSRVTGWTH
uniref:Uncharacterized protein n=1 Tax=Picea sitchensis TaxID=3332 RepID=A0A6B9XZF5_PICSI|nr:hypothetical protein Q903MT_gene6893 [Picea sitchensis]